MNDLIPADLPALVCAASKGLGQAVAKALAAKGHPLVLCARGAQALTQTAEDLKAAYNVPVHTVAVDLTEPHGRAQLLEALNQLYPQGPAIVVHNTGGPLPSTSLQTSMAAWQAGFESLFLPGVELNQALVPLMQVRGWGRIITITSLTVLEPSPTLAVSNAMRAALTSYNKTLATDLAPDGITVNNVAPGLIYTQRLAALYDETSLKEQAQSIAAGRLGEPEEFAAAVAFLASAEASYITGTTLSVDGGRRKAPF